LYNHRENVEYHICQMEIPGEIFWSSEKRMNKFKNSHAMNYQLFKGVCYRFSKKKMYKWYYMKSSVNVHKNYILHAFILKKKVEDVCINKLSLSGKLKNISNLNHHILSEILQSSYKYYINV
jgi:hypothetical protein